MKRRDFIGGSLTAGAFWVAGNMPMQAAEAAAAGAGGPADTDANFPWLEKTVAELSAAMGAGEITALGLTRAYLGRIAKIDRAGPLLNSVIEINPDAESIALERDAERSRGVIRGPLHGIPVLVKDNLDTGDRMLTTAGSLALADHPAPADSPVVAQLRAAGAVLLGKTNLSEWANFRSTHSVSGWSGRGGQTRNPCALDRNPSGSSSGSAVAVAANLCAAAVGTETDGSVVSPASVCGIVGMKPTVGLVSRSGIIPISSSQDTAGPMGRTVRDVAVLLSAMTGIDPADTAMAGRPAALPIDYTLGLDEPALTGARLGVVRGPFAMHPKLDPLLDAILGRLREAGAVLVDPVEIPAIEAVSDPEFEVMLFEFKAGLNAYLTSRGATTAVRTLEDLIRYNREHADTEMGLFAQELFEMAQAKGDLSDPAYLEALATCRRLSRDEGIDGALRAHKLDALVMLTNGPAWPIDPVNGDSYTGGSSTLAAVAGYPTITVPAGGVMGLPVGLSFVGPAWAEHRLLKLAADFERRFPARRVPTMRRSVMI